VDVGKRSCNLVNPLIDFRVVSINFDCSECPSSQVLHFDVEGVVWAEVGVDVFDDVGMIANGEKSGLVRIEAGV
jgi:hypothetical protein